jgi:hypothetical protein
MSEWFLARQLPGTRGPHRRRQEPEKGSFPIGSWAVSISLLEFSSRSATQLTKEKENLKHIGTLITTDANSSRTYLILGLDSTSYAAANLWQLDSHFTNRLAITVQTSSSPAAAMAEETNVTYEQLADLEREFEDAEVELSMWSSSCSSRHDT